MNDWCADPPGELDAYWGFPAELAWRTAALKGAANVPMHLDGIYVDAFPLHIDEPPAYFGQYDNGSACWSVNAMKVFCIDRHNGGPNSVFADGSVRKVGLKELWRLKWHRRFKTNEPAWDWASVAPWMLPYREY
jgi:prepilin-type processing-associated H-X9-DG protein